MLGKIIECDGKWFGCSEFTVIWSDDHDDLMDILSRMGKETVCIGEGYSLWSSPAGKELAIPKPELLTPRQRGVVLEFVEDILKKHGN